MAEEHNALKYGPRISSAAAVTLGGGYGDVGISRVSESIVVVQDLFDHRTKPEWALPRGEKLFARRVQSAAVAARFSTVELVNPSLTMLLVVDLIQLTTNSTWQIDSGAAVAANPVVTRGVCEDGRDPQLGAVSIATLTTGDTAAATNLPQGISFSSVTPVRMRMILPPGPTGNRLFIAGPGVLTQLDLMIQWRERQPFPGELQVRG